MLHVNIRQVAAKQLLLNGCTQRDILNNEIIIHCNQQPFPFNYCIIVIILYQIQANKRYVLSQIYWAPIKPSPFHTQGQKT